MNNYTATQVSRNVLDIEFTDMSAGWEQYAMLSSDRHHDNIACRRELERKHLDQALERDALIFDFGDLFCAMQGKWDPRASMDSIRPEDVGEDYLDRIVDHAYEDYKPYTDRFVLIGRGNHESNIRKRHGIDLISNLVHKFNSNGGRCFNGEYGGWVRFRFVVNGTKRRSLIMKYHHGAGGGGPVTRGVIQTNRQSVYTEADIVINGHTHDSWVVPISRERLNRRAIIERSLIWFIRTPGYMDGYGDGARGFEVETWKPPKPIGCIWVKFYIKDIGSGLIGMKVEQDVHG